ncbi:MAG: prepilin-type N-terminal cleavage/methylation domain-containing protein [Armatimonadetes bacterium]|nr:prepilin-type N-terminal cleavage/methylation domain-containing protein [Armatimonadota bacterium]
MKKAFTLIELLVVIAIIAILAAILFPVFTQAKESAKNTQCLSNGKQIGLAVKMYLNDSDDLMPIFYAYNSVPAAGVAGHKGVEVLLFPYTKSKEIFKSPLDQGGPYTALDVPGANTYHKAYGSSYRFTKCMYTVVSGESSTNNYVITDPGWTVTETSISSPSESRAMRAEMLPWFDRKNFADACNVYGYDCDAPNNYYTKWSGRGGTLIFVDGHAKFQTSKGQFDATVVSPAGNKSGDAHPSQGSWYYACD